MFFKRLQKLIKRHPFLYLTRFRLLSKNSSVAEIRHCTYNQANPKAHIPKLFYEINQQIFETGVPTSDLDKVLQLSTWLKEHIKGGPGLSEPSGKALKTMLSGKGGVCSDMAQVFNNFCVLNDIKVREWGNTTVPFNRLYGGHSFNEVFIREWNKWVLIDVYWGFMFYDQDDNPLSVIEFYTLKRENQQCIYRSYLKETVAPNTVEKNYLNPGIVPFLICDYQTRVYDAFLRYARPLLPVFMVHFMIYLVHQSYHYRFPMDDYRHIFS